MGTTLNQRMSSLAKANEVRMARVALKRRVGAGNTTAAEVILSPPDEALTWAVGDLLLAQRRWGVSRVRRVLARTATEHTVAIGEMKRLGELTDRQRRLLARRLG